MNRPYFKFSYQLMGGYDSKGVGIILAEVYYTHSKLKLIEKEAREALEVTDSATQCIIWKYFSRKTPEIYETMRRAIK